MSLLLSVVNCYVFWAGGLPLRNKPCYVMLCYVMLCYVYTKPHFLDILFMLLMYQISEVRCPDRSMYHMRAFFRLKGVYFLIFVDRQLSAYLLLFIITNI